MNVTGKVNLFMTSVIGITLVILILIWLNVLREYRDVLQQTIQDEFMQSGLETTDQIAQLYFSAIENERISPKEAMMRAQDFGLTSGYVVLMSLDGQVVESSERLPTEMLSVLSPELIARARDNAIVRNQFTFFADNYANADEEAVAGGFLPVRVYGRVYLEEDIALIYGRALYVILARISALDDELQDSQDRLLLIGFILSLIATVTNLVLGWQFTRRVIRKPIRALVKGIEKFEKNTEVVFDIPGEDEFALFGMTLNVFQGRINRLLGEAEQSEESLRIIINLNENAVFVESDDSQLLFYNDAAALLCEETMATRMEADNSIQAFYADLKLNFATELEMNRATAEIDGLELPLNKKQQWWRVVTSPFITTHGDAATIVTLVDITERKLYTEKVEALNAELESRVQNRTKELELINVELNRSYDNLKQAQTEIVEQEKMASLALLTAGMSHELNTPIGIGVTGISSLRDNLSKLKNNTKLTRAQFDQTLGDMDELAEITEVNLKKAAELVRGFKQLASNQATNEAVLFRLDETLDSIALSLKPKISRTQHTLTIENECGDLQLFGFPSSYTQLFTNLITNSLVHGFDGVEQGEIIVRLSQPEDDQIKIEYSDNGVGMDKESLTQLYDPFFTTKRGRGGTGLGMHIVYNQVVQTLNGKIHVESEPGKGVQYEFLIPYNKELLAAEHTYG